MVANRPAVFAFSLDVGGTIPGLTTGAVLTAKQLGFAVIGEPTFPSFILGEITEQTGKPYEDLLPGPLPVANRRLEFVLGEWDERVLRIGGREYQKLGTIGNNGEQTDASEFAGKPEWEFRALHRRSADERLKVTRFQFEGAIDIPNPAGFTGGEYARLSLVARDIQAFRMYTTAWLDPDLSSIDDNDWSLITDISLPDLKYSINGYDRWRGYNAALGLT